MSKFSLKYVKVVIYRCGDPKLSHTHLDQELDFYTVFVSLEGGEGKESVSGEGKGLYLSLVMLVKERNLSIFPLFVSLEE